MAVNGQPQDFESNTPNEDAKLRSTSKQLLYCEYNDSSVFEPVLQRLVKGKKERPNISFSTSSVLNKVKDFLPLMEKAEKELQLRPPEDYNVEAVEDDKPVIELDLALYKDISDDENSVASGEEHCDSSEGCDSEEEPLDLSLEKNKKQTKTLLIQEIDDSTKTETE